MKRSKKLLVLAIVLAVMVAAYGVTALIVHKLDEENAVTETEGTFALVSYTVDDISVIGWNYSGTDYSVTKRAGTWTLDGTDAFRLDTDAIDEMAETIVNLTAVRSITGGLEKSAYGLETPTLQFYVTLNDGTTYNYAQGDQNSVTEEYYFCVNDEIYTVSSTVKTSFNKNKKNLFVYDDIPDLTELKTLTLTLGENVYEIVALEDGSEYDYAGTHTYFLKQDDTYIPLDNTLAEAMFEEARTLKWTALEEYEAAEEDINDKYGFAEPTLLINVDGFEIEIGGAYSSYYFYARLPGADIIYRIDDDLTDLATEFSVESYLDAAVLGLENVTEFTLTSAAGEFTYLKQEEEDSLTYTNDEGEEETTLTTVTVAYLNGAEIEETVFDTMLETVTGLTALSFPEAEPAGEALLSISAPTGNESIPTVEMSIYEYDAESYLCVRSDGRTMTVDAATVDGIVRQLKNL